MKITHNGYAIHKKECVRCGREFFTTAKLGKICILCNRSKNKIRYEITLSEVEKWKRKKLKKKTRFQ